MASNAFASISAATTAGWVLERFTRNGKNVTKLSKPLVGQTGTGGHISAFEGEGPDSATADTVALGNLNFFRGNRYGQDSAGASVSSIPNEVTKSNGGPTLDKQPTHAALTKDKS